MQTHKEKVDESLVEEAKRATLGNHKAFEELVRRYRGKVLANCIYLTRSTDAEDLAQEVFLKAFFGIKKFESRSSFRTWLQRIKVNHCLNYLRRQKNKEYVDLSTITEEFSQGLHTAPVEGKNIDRAVKKQQIKAILGQIPDTLRIPLVLCDMDGLSYQECADELNIGLSAFKMRLKRAREYFRRELSKHVNK